MLKPGSKENFIKYEIIEHLSDVKISAYGKTMEGLFENAAEGMFSIITNLGNVKKTVKNEIKIDIKEKVEPENLLIIWLEKLLYLCEVESLFFSYFKITDLKNNNKENSLTALVKGEKINMAKHEILLQVKAPTYHELHITQEEKTGVYNVEIILDV